MGLDILYLLAGAIVAAVIFFLCSVPALGVYQQCGYSGRELNGWYFRKKSNLKQRYILLSLACVLLTALLSLCFSFLGSELCNLISAAGLIGMGVLFFYSKHSALKVSLVRTSRMIRLSVCYYLLLVALIFGLCVGLWYAAEAIGHDLARVFRFVPVAVLPVFFPPIVSVAGFLMKGYELPRNRRFCERAKKKLHESSCIKVGITGSFGKTSVKEYASCILSEKFKTVATPASFNTPMGIARTVEELGLDCDVFLAEMGARHVGDIKELCDIVPLDFAVVTGICNQHLETFGSLGNIVREKGEIVKCAKLSVLGASASEIQGENVLREGKDFAAEEIVCSTDGTKFRLRLGAETVNVETALLGRHAAEDIALAAALCSALGMTAEEIATGISKICPVPHRLQLTESGGLYLLDDSYNSNVEGAKNAVEVLKLFPKKKYVITPGIVELGEMQEECNEKLGELFVGLDKVILVGETLVGAVKNGYERAGGDKDRLRIVSSLQNALIALQPDMERGDCLLFLNDLPDRY